MLSVETLIRNLEYDLNAALNLKRRFEEQAQLLNHRYVIYPICYECASHLRELGFLEKIEENIILARRRAKLFKSDDGWLWWGLETS